MKCEICGKEILRDSQCINYKYYHNDCIENLLQENKQLKIQISAREEVCNRLESNWNKLKEYLNYKSERSVGEDEYVYDEIYNEMQELKQGSD